MILLGRAAGPTRLIDLLVPTVFRGNPYGPFGLVCIPTQERGNEKPQERGNEKMDCAVLLQLSAWKLQSILTLAVCHHAFALLNQFLTFTDIILPFLLGVLSLFN